MLKGLALTPPVLGRISIGKVIEKNGKRLPDEAEYSKIFYGIGYVTKNDQPLLVKPKGRRTYGKGQMPKRRY